jgi:CheY-like chemotaxis protein
VGDLAAADVIVGDAEPADSVAQVRALGRLGDTVFIGENAPEGSAAHLPRPIDALQVLRETEALAARRPRPGFVLLEPQAPGAAPPRASNRPSALRVDDSANAVRYLQLHLQRLDIDADLASGSGPTLEMLAQRAYGYVFIDVELGAASLLDGLSLCQHIKRQHRHVEDRAPVLVLVWAHHGEVDRARGTFAGCDHYLAKPADEKALRALLSQFRPKPAPRIAHC